MRAVHMSAGTIALVLAGACSSGDLTLPASSAPAELHVVSGDDQRAEAGEILPEPLTVRVLDAEAQPVPRTPIVFGFVGQVEGAVVDPATALTDEQGRAGAVARLGEDPGEQQIVARVADTDAPDLQARFTVVAVEPDDDDGGRKGKKGKKGGRGEEDDDRD